MKLTKRNIPVIFRVHGYNQQYLKRGYEVEGTKYGIYHSTTVEWWLTDIQTGQVLDKQPRRKDIIAAIEKREGVAS